MYVNENMTKGNVEEFVKKSNPKIKKKYEFVLQLIADERIKAARTMVRIIFYKIEENIILLYAFHKRDKKDTEQALEYALKIIKTLDKKVLVPFEMLEEVEIH